jgi:hypothetical protein
MDVLAGTAFFTVEVLTWRGLITYYILFFIEIGSRRASLGGITRYPDSCWMEQVARVLPPPISGGAEHVVFTTPYMVLQPGLRDWQAYFRRTLPEAPQQARLDAYARHMKHEPTRMYWNDFVFEAYVNHRTEVIYLAGLPDVSESRPHSEVHGWGFGQ